MVKRCAACQHHQVCNPKEATQKHVSALQETKIISAVKSTPRSQSCQQNKPNYSTQPKRPPFTRQNFKQQQGCLNCGLNHHRHTTCPAHKATCNFCGKKGHWEKVWFQRGFTENYILTTSTNLESLSQKPRLFQTNSKWRHTVDLNYAISGTSLQQYAMAQKLLKPSFL